MANRVQIPTNNSSLIAMIADEDTIVGFLMAGVGNIDIRRRTNYLIVDSKTTVKQIEDAFKEFTTRDDIAIVLISQFVANMIRFLVDSYNKSVSAILEIPSKDHPYDPAHDSVLSRGFAKYVEWSANMMEEEAKRRLKTAELQAKKTRLRLWTNYVPPPTNSKAIHDQNFTGKVVEVVSGDCIIVADDSIPYGSPLAERRVNLSSIRCPKMGNPRRDEKPAPYAREAKEFLRTHLLGRQVNVQMECSRNIGPADGSAVPSGAPGARTMDFGSVFLPGGGSTETVRGITNIEIVAKLWNSRN